ncbi:MAG: GNAT family N-acetyltransferase [Streptosporangiales bacterium]
MNADYRSLIEAGQVWVADQGGLLVGLLVLEFERDYLLLDNVAVAPNAQGTGVGAQLLDFTDEQARDHDLSEVRLYTNEAMIENIAYYPRHGFVETHRAADHGYRRVYFTKSL